MRALALSLACAVLAGCAMTEMQCRTANWAELGQRDGSMGMQPQVDQYLHQCGALGVKVADQDYMTSWRDAHREFIYRTSGSESM